MRFVHSVSTLRARWERDFAPMFERAERAFSADGKNVRALGVSILYHSVLVFLQRERLSADMRVDVVRLLDGADYSPVLNEQILLFRRDVMLRR